MALHQIIDTSPRFIALDLERQLLSGTFKHALDHEIDLSALDARYRNDLTGATAYPPATFLKLVLFAYSQGVVSSRGIERLCREHAVVIALSGDSQPHFSTIAGLIGGLGDEIAKVFTSRKRGRAVKGDRGNLRFKQIFPPSPFTTFTTAVARSLRATKPCARG